MNRREFLRSGAVATSLPLLSSAASSANPSSSSQQILRKAGQLSWLEGKEPALKLGRVWGKPWAEGELKRAELLKLRSQMGTYVPLQSWPTAFWPDGSVKWTAHAVAGGYTLGEHFSIEKGRGPQPQKAVKIHRGARYFTVDTGVFKCVVPTRDNILISRLERNGKVIAQDARLVGMRQNLPDIEPGQNAKIESFESKIKQVQIEQEGPVRAVIKVDGVCRTESRREWLPFVLRMIFYAGDDSMKITHSFIYDGDDQQDFIRAMGLEAKVPMRDALYDRHIRIVGEGHGLWAESPRGITGLRRDPGQAVKAAQIAGEPTPVLESWDKRVSSRLHWVPVWNDVTLTQLNANGFTIRKRTKAGHAWIDADQGGRAAGVAYVGGISGGLLMGMRDFWQLHPVQLDIRDCGTDMARATLWFWSPEAPAMDVRFYHDGYGADTYEKQLDALNITYEDYEPGFGQAYGIARSSEFTLQVLDATPSRQALVDMADDIRLPAQVVSAPQDILKTAVFGGNWSLPDRSTAKKAALEGRLDWMVDFYCAQVDQRHWYGFWHYRNVMHAYDPERHVWRYDIGGYAWDNSELSPDLWLWYSFLRTGDAKVFRLAEAMTRHNRDVDIYHAGRFKGFGTRHNVQHWGCSAKQLRISTAAYRRFHYFLTADERTGDVMNEVIDADEALATLNATRKLPGEEPLEKGLGRMGVGTDLGSVFANWLTAWERSGDERYRQRLENAMRTVGAQEHGFFSGSFEYDPDKKVLIPVGRGPSVSHLSTVFGLTEMCTELNQLLDIPEFKRAWLRYGRFYGASEQQQQQEFGESFRPSLINAHSRNTAYTAHHEKDEQLALRAWREFHREWRRPDLRSRSIEGPAVLNPVAEVDWLSTNECAQWGLAAIQNLFLIPEALEQYEEALTSLRL
ncbi:MAG: Tat pathway signal sequence domain protein [Cellvibrionaceae bacterium]|nr:Tat pathway signal sequence domain protein [Cellvibrionaceae bacterium]